MLPGAMWDFSVDDMGLEYSDRNLGGGGVNLFLKLSRYKFFNQIKLTYKIP